MTESRLDQIQTTWLHTALWLKSTSNDFVVYACIYATDDWFLRLWCRRSSIQGLTTALLSSSGYQLTYSDVFSLYSTPRLVSCSGFVASRYDCELITMLSQLFTGCVYLGLSSRSLWSGAAIYVSSGWCCRWPPFAFVVTYPDRSSSHISLRPRGHSFDVPRYKYDD